MRLTLRWQPRLAALMLALAVICVNTLPAAAQPAQPARTGESSDAARTHYAAAVALQNRELFDTAAEEWASFLVKFPSDPRADRAQHYLGVCYLQSKQYDKAIAAFDKVIVTYPKFELQETSRYFLGLSHYNAGQAGKKEAFAEAEKVLAALVAKSPKGLHAAEATYYRGECCYAQNKLAEAAAFYAALVKDHPQSKLVPDALYAQGISQQALGKPELAAQAYASFLTQFPKHNFTPEVTFRRGECLLAMGQAAEAEKLLAAAAAIPGFALADDALVQQAAAAARRQQYAEAAAIYASLPTRFPKSKHLAQAQVGAGRCYYLAAKYAEARAWLAKSLDAGGAEAPEAAHWIARSYLKENQPAEALKTTDRVLAKPVQGPFAPQLLMDKADALEKLPNRRSDAVAAYAALAEKYPQDPLAADALYLAAFNSLGQADYSAALKHAGEFEKKFANHTLSIDVGSVAAESNLQAKNLPQAESQYQQLLARHTQHADAPQWRLRHGLALFLQKKYPETVAAMELGMPAFKTPDAQAEAHYLIGASHSELKQYDAAARSLDAALKAKEDWRQADETLLLLGLAQRQLNNTPAALAAVQKLVAKFPNSQLLDRAHYRWGEFAYAAGDLKSAAAEYQRVVLKWPDSPLAPHALYGLGWAQLGQQDYPAAAQSFTTLVDGYPQDALAPRGRYARALARQQLKQYAPAVEDIQAFLKAQPMAPEKPDALYLLGLCQTGLKKAGEAAATYRSLIADHPQYAGLDKAHYELAWAYKDQSKEAEAADTFGKLAAQFENSPLAAESLYHVGEHNYLQNDFKKAANAYFTAMNKAGKTDLGEKAAHKLAWSYYRQDDWSKAQQTFAYQRATYPQGSLAADATFMEAESLFKQAKHTEALALYEQVKNPSSPDFAVLALLHGGQAAAQLKQWPKSLQLLEQCSKQYPEAENLAEVLYEQGWAKQNLSKTDEALALYESAAAKGANREVAARARFMVGEIYFEKKDHENAVRNFYKAAFGYSYPQWQANALYEAARCLEVLNKKEQAKKDYQEVVTKYPQSDKAPLAQKRLTELGG